MAELSGKQKKHLRGLAQRLAAVASVGKAGLTDPVVAGVRTLLEQHELAKIRIPAGSGEERQQMASELATKTDAELIAVIGRVVVLYRANTDLAKSRRVPLA